MNGLVCFSWLWSCDWWKSKALKRWKDGKIVCAGRNICRKTQTLSKFKVNILKIASILRPIPTKKFCPFIITLIPFIFSSIIGTYSIEAYQFIPSWFQGHLPLLYHYYIEVLCTCQSNTAPSADLSCVKETFAMKKSPWHIAEVIPNSLCL